MTPSVGTPEFSTDELDGSAPVDPVLEPEYSQGRSVVAPIALSLLVVVAMLFALSSTRDVDRDAADGRALDPPADGEFDGSLDEIDAPVSTTTIVSPEAVDDILVEELARIEAGLESRFAEVGRDPFERRVVDLVVSPMAAIGDGYGGFISGTTVDGVPLFATSDNGFGWANADSVQATGLPDGSVPRGLWEALDGSLIGAFTRAAGDASTLWFATSPDGAAWSVGPSFGSDVRLVVEEVVPTLDGALLTISESAGGGDRSIQSYIWARDEEELYALDVQNGAYISAATDSPFGLVVAVSPTSKGDAGFGGEIRLYADSDNWTSLDLDTGPLPTLEVVPAAFPEVLMVTINGAFRTDWDRLLTNSGDLVWEQVAGVIPDDIVGAVEVRDVRAGSGGAAALLLERDELDRFTVVVTRDYRTWTPVVIGNESQGEPTYVQIDAVGQDEVILSGFAQGPYRVRVPLDG